MGDSISSQRAPAAVGAYPHARRHGNLLFLSGLGPRPPGGGPVAGVVLDDEGEVASYDFAAQVHAVFKNVRIVLEDAGADWSDLLDITVYLIDIKKDFSTFNHLYADYFDLQGPCRTTVEVNRLPTPIAIELKCIAALHKTP
ncbi:MAG: RidA family protein [Woeseia sp.]|nr:RidA family protein [Woeseia sp.]MBT8096315.1 RidA family protein [Woeseia sp.]NNE60133.1 RidA family protein [Woeseia sp.]